MRKARALPRIATIYRGIKDVERIRLDLSGVTELSQTEAEEAKQAAADGAREGSRGTQVASAEPEPKP